MRASRADEKERDKKKKEENNAVFLKANISRCVYAFRQVIMFSWSFYYISAIRFSFELQL